MDITLSKRIIFSQFMILFEIRYSKLPFKFPKSKFDEKVMAFKVEVYEPSNIRFRALDDSKDRDWTVRSASILSARFDLYLETCCTVYTIGTTSTEFF